METMEKMDWKQWPDDICNTCAFEDACPSAHFHPTGRNICGDYKSIKKTED